MRKRERVHVFISMRVCIQLQHVYMLGKIVYKKKMYYPRTHRGAGACPATKYAKSDIDKKMREEDVFIVVMPARAESVIKKNIK